MGDDARNRTPQGVDVLALDLDDLEPVTLERLLQLVAFEVLGGVARDGDIVIVYRDSKVDLLSWLDSTIKKPERTDQELDVEILRDRQPCSLRVVTLLLRPIRSEAEHRLVPVSQGNSVDERPHVAQAAGGELDARGQAEFRVAGQLRVGFTVVE